MLFHANVIFDDPKYFGVAPAPLFLAGAAGVPFFFVLSGYIIARSHDSTQAGFRNAANFLLKRVLRLYPLLWTVLLIALPATYVAAKHAWPATYLIFSFLALPTTLAPPLAVEWTLQHEMLFYLAYAAIIIVPKSRTLLLALLACGSLAGIFIQAQYPWWFFLDSSHAALRHRRAYGNVPSRIGRQGALYTAGIRCTALCRHVCGRAASKALRLYLTP